jgi:uncharacterized SAM-binding protein YcdF (DUF218 family)
MNMNFYLLTPFVLFAVFAISWRHRPARLINGFFANFAILTTGSIFFLLFANGSLDFTYRELAAGIIFIGIFMAVFGFLGSLVFLFLNAAAMFRHERISLANMLGFLLALAMVALIIFDFFVEPNSWPIWIRPLYFMPIILWLMIAFDALNFFTLSVLYNISGRFFAKKHLPDYVIVLGAGLIDGQKVGRLLGARIHRGAQIISRNSSSVKLVMSGGKGSDERVAEAVAMADFAKTELGVKSSRIIVEDKSATTAENLRFSREKIAADFAKKDPSVVIVSNNYHVVRAAMLAQKLGLNWRGVGAKTRFYYLPSAWLRELIAIIRPTWKVRAAAFCLILLAASLIIWTHFDPFQLG